MNKVVIITGGSSGIGLAMACRFVNDKANVVITGRTEDKLQKAVSKIGGSVLAIQMDVRKPEDVTRMVKEVDENFGRIDFLVNNAAGNFPCPAEKLSINGWHSVIDTVLHGTWYCSSEVGKYWINKKISGCILNIVTTYAGKAGPGVIHSACAKSAVLSMTKTLAVEWGKYGIRVNAIAPGFVERTGGAEKFFFSDQVKDKVIQSVPLGRLGNPEEIASLASFLFSDAAYYINGNCITMDGGQCLNEFVNLSSFQH